MISVPSSVFLGIYRFGFFVCVMAVSWLAFGSPPSNIAATVSDKVLHGVAFLVLGYLLSGALPGHSFWKVVLPVLLAYGFFIELVQWQLSHRDFSLLDFAADAAGLLLYWICHKPIWTMSNFFLSEKSASTS